LSILNTSAQTPFTAKAGVDSIFCNPYGLDTNYMGGLPAATGGTTPYSYQWDIFPKPFVPIPSLPQLKFYCSDFLSDTTKPNPRLLMLPPNQVFLNFILKVTDDSGYVAIDTVKHLEEYWVFVLGQGMTDTYPGDTQTVSVNWG